MYYYFFLDSDLPYRPLIIFVHVIFDHQVYEWATQAFFIYSGDPEIRKKSSISYNQPNAQTINQQFQMGALPMQSTSQPFANPQFMGDSGVEQNENSLYGDTTLINNRISMYNQPQNRNFASASYLNSPQQMSTPIAMRTKQEFNAAYPTNTQPFGSRSNAQNQFQQPFGSQQNADNISQQLKQKFQSPQAGLGNYKIF